MYKSLVFGDEFLAHGLHLKSQQRSSAGIRTWLYAKKVICYGIFYVMFMLWLYADQDQ